MSSPRSMRTPVSSTLKSPSSSSLAQALVRRRLTSGTNIVNTCFPVHRGSGLRMAGLGTLPSQFSSHIRMFMKTSLVMNVSRLVIRRHASSVSCTIAITGLFACGETIIFGTIMSSCTSARVSIDCGRCMFISSPSKSALYGGVTEMFILNVEYGMMRTRWPMMDILCREGWRLNSTQSPLIMCRSTLYPYSSLFSLSFFRNLRSMRCPSSRMMYFAPVSPGGGCGPFSTSFFSRSMLYGVTVSGYVMLSAMLHGTPSSSSIKLGSGVMTVRAEKSTRFPIRFPRMRPFFPLRRSEMLLIGRPLRVSARGIPATVLSMNVMMWYCSSSVNSPMTCCGAPFCSCRSRFLFVRTISMSFTVKSSSDRVDASNATEGRTGCGGTGMTLRMNHEGCACLGSRPRISQSSSETFLRIDSAFSAVMTCLRSPPSGR